jgi:hypothetical protein
MWIEQAQHIFGNEASMDLREHPTYRQITTHDLCPNSWKTSLPIDSVQCMCLSGLPSIYIEAFECLEAK